MLPEPVADARTPHASQKTPRTHSSAWLGAAIVALAFVAAAASSWRKWPHPLIDFGMQLYLAWKVSTGLVLSCDASYIDGGPFSQYFNGELFRIFGVSLMTLVWANVLIAAGLIAVMYRRFLKAGDVFTATLIGVAVALVFAFPQYSGIGNYNFVTPYCYETWHGLVLSVAAVALISSWATKQKLAYASGAGFCAGLVFMTKPDIFVALAATMLAGFIFCAVLTGKARLLRRSLAAFLVSAILPLSAFLIYFRQHEPWHESLRSVYMAWVPLLESHVSQTPFYKWCMGMDAPWLNARRMLIQFVIVCSVLVVSALVCRRDLSKPAHRLIAVGWTVLLIGLARNFKWVDCGRSLPLLTGVLLLMLLVEFWKTRDASLGFPLLWSTFALLLLAKLGLYSRIWHYGFALGMPASATVIYLLVWLLPRRLEHLGVDRRWFRWIVALPLLTGMACLFSISQSVYHVKTVAVGKGPDQFFAFSEQGDPTGADIQSALEWLDRNTPKDATLAVLPQGAMLNYLSRRTNPGHYLAWDGPMMAVFGSAKMTADFEAHPPDYIILAHHNDYENGLDYFGKEERFGLELMQWIRKNYEPVKLIGSEPLVDSNFGIKILHRRKSAG